jgi:hypothetical protein
MSPREDGTCQAKREGVDDAPPDKRAPDWVDAAALVIAIGQMILPYVGALIGALGLAVLLIRILFR